MSEYEILVDPSAGTENGPAEELYDLLYKDVDRLNSYYAQVFSGRLLSQEKTESERTSTEGSIKGNAAVVAGEAKRTGETSSSGKSVIDPHDQSVIDIISYFSDNRYYTRDIDSAVNGQMVIVKGSVFFVDETVTRMTLTMSLSQFAAKNTARPGTPAFAEHKTIAKHLNDWASKSAVPSSFCFISDVGNVLCGVIRESSLQDVLSSYHFRHGSSGLTGVEMIGIKEVPFKLETPFDIQTPGFSPLGNASRQMADVLTDLVFPPDAIRITPIVFFRRIVHSQVL